MAVATIILIGVYFGFREIAAACTGAACDAYVPVSLLLPVLVLALVAVTGVAGTVLARPHRAWFAVLVAATLLGVSGPIASLVIFRDNPDILVPLATGLELVAAISALGFSFFGRQQTR